MSTMTRIYRTDRSPLAFSISYARARVVRRGVCTRLWARVWAGLCARIGLHNLHNPSAQGLCVIYFIDFSVKNSRVFPTFLFMAFKRDL